MSPQILTFANNMPEFFMICKSFRQCVDMEITIIRWIERDTRGSKYQYHNGFPDADQLGC